MSEKPRKSAKSRFADFCIVVICLSGALYALNLFRLDLFGTITLQHEEPVGIIIARTNVVQRRFAERALWGRLAANSPVFLGDLIRVAELSSASLYIDGTHISLNENTLIRIQRSPDAETPFQITLDEGSLSLSADEQGGALMLNLQGRQVLTAPGTVLNAAAGDEGMVLEVSEGAALFMPEEGGEAREIASGAMIALDVEGAEFIRPATVVMHPPPDARFLNDTPQALPVNFAWNRFYLQPDELLRLEIAEDRNFNRVVTVIEDLDDNAQTVFDTGLWHWRLSFDELVLSAGRLTVTPAAGPELISPITNSTYRFQDYTPAIRFQWSEIAGAASYLFEASRTPDFTHPQITRNAGAPFLIDSTMDPGTWYWRVMPVFPPMYSGNAAFSLAAFFHLEQSAEIIEEELLFVLPDPEPPPPPEPEPLEIQLLIPPAGATLAGLTALRQQTVFNWNIDEPELHSRFILSRTSNPLAGVPAVEIANPPGRSVSLGSLEAGRWYWTVEAHSTEGIVSAAETRLLQVLPIPLLPMPLNRLPAQGHHIGVPQLRAQRNIVFSWSAVPGANAYIFALYQQTAGARQLILRTEPLTGTSWTLENISVLARGTFFWQVEAVNRAANNAIEQRGQIAENTFTLDVPLPGPVLIEEPGIFYGGR